jgi:hypothetical protein
MRCCVTGPDWLIEAPSYYFAIAHHDGTHRHLVSISGLLCEDERLSHPTFVIDQI